MFNVFYTESTPAEVKGYIQTLDENDEIVDLFYFEYNAYGAILKPIDAMGNLGANMAIDRDMVISFIAKFEL